MEEQYRLLHHLIEWTNRPNAGELADAALALDPRDFYEQDGFILRQTGTAVVYDIAASHYRETGDRVPQAELNRQVQVIAKSDPNLYGQANAAIAAASQFVSNGSDIPSIATAIKNESKSRKLYATLGKIAQEKSWEDPDKATRELSDVLAELGSSACEEETLIEYNSPRNIQRRVDLYVDKMQKPEQHKGVSIGWPFFDVMTGGLRGGQTLFVAADAKTGKSTFCAASIANAICIAEAAGVEMDAVVAHREMKESWQSDRIEAYMMWRNERMKPYRGLTQQIALSKRISDGKLTPEERVIYAETMTKMAEMKNKIWMVEPDGYSTLEELGGIIRRIKRKRNVGIVYIDALGGQKLGRYGRFTDNKVNEIADLARATEELAFDLDVPVIVEIQERRETAELRFVDARDISANSPAAIPQIACYLLRLFNVPGGARIVEAQLLASRFCEQFSFPMIISPGDMIVEELPMSTMSQIDSMCKG